MLLLDVNVLVYAHREDAPDHKAFLDWLEALINSDQAYGMSDLVLSGFLRIVTHPRIFDPPSSIGAAWSLPLKSGNNPIVFRLCPAGVTGTSSCAFVET